MFDLHAINPAFVAASAVALVPIILHLVQRRRRRRVVFGSVRFLRKMSQRSVRRRRLTELILILLRAAALLVLALGFARLFHYARGPRAFGGGGDAEGAMLVLVDNSYSMTRGDRLERAKAEAAKVVKAAGLLTRVAVAEFSGAIAESVDFDATRPEALDRIDAIKPSYRPTRLGAVLQRAGEILAGRPEPVRRIVLISDLQQSCWEQGRDSRLPPGVELDPRPIAAAGESANVFVDGVEAPSLAVAGGFREPISARIANRTDQPVTDADVTLTVDGKKVETRQVTIQPRSDALVRFPLTFGAAGEVTGTIAVTFDDAMPADNQGCFAVPVAPKARVLLVNGDPDPRRVRNDAFFLTTALAPDTPGRPSPFAVRQVAPDKLTAKDIRESEAVLLANVDTIPAPAVEALREFLYTGGGAAFLPGAKTDPDRFNKTFRVAPEPIAPCQLWKQALADGDEPAIITWTDLQHDIFLPFAGPRNGDLAVAGFRQYFLVNDSQTARVLARFGSGHPALLEKLCSRDGAAAAGRSILMTSSADLEWNDLCLKGVFVPFVHQLCRRLCAERSGGWARELVVGDEAVVPLGGRAEDVRVTGPDGKEVAAAVSDDGGVRFRPETPGIYTLAHADGQARFAANLAPGEADLAEMDVKVLTTAVRPAPSASGRATGGVTVVSARTAEERVEQSQHIWIYLIAAALALLGIEMLLGARAAAA